MVIGIIYRIVHLTKTVSLSVGAISSAVADNKYMLNCNLLKLCILDECMITLLNFTVHFPERTIAAPPFLQLL